MNAKEINDLATHLEKEFGGQKDNDQTDKDLIRQKHVIDAQQDPKRKVSPVGTGYGKLVTAQNRSYLSATPFTVYTAPKDTLKAHAEMLGAATQAMWKLSGAHLAWLRSIRDVVDIGRGWLLIHPVPKLWKTPEFEQGDESYREYADRLLDLKLANWPIIAQHIDARNTWPTFTLKREVDQVVSIGKMTVRQVKEAYRIEVKGEDTEKLTVISYADHTHMKTVIAAHGGTGVGKFRVGGIDAETVSEWEHGMKMNPYVLMEAPPLSENDDGVLWEGSVAALRYLIPEMDGALTDWRHNTKRQTHSQTVYELDLESRRAANPDAQSNADLITKTPDGEIITNLNEKIYPLEGARTNPDIPGVIAAMRSFTQENAIRSALLGISEGGESGVEYNTKAQIAQKDFGPAIDFLSAAAENVDRHFIASIISFSETFKDIKVKEDIPLYYVDAEGISKKSSLSASDVRGWENRLQAKIDLAIPVNRNQEIITARMASDLQNGVLSLETAITLYTPVANPLEEIRKRDLDKIRAALVQQRVQAALQLGAEIASAPANADILAQDFAALPPSVQAAIQSAAQSQGQTVPEARGQANIVREGRGQALSQTEAMGVTSGVGE